MKKKKVEETEDTKVEEVAPARVVEPGDLVDTVRQLRRLMAEYDSISYTLFASFEELGGKDLDEAATRTRRATTLAGERLFQLLSAIERLPVYVAMKKEFMARNKQRSAEEEDNG